MRICELRQAKFQMKQFKNAFLVTAYLLVLSSCSSDKHDRVGSFDEVFETAYNDYKIMPDYKAFALAKDTDGHWAYGYGQNHPNQAEANTQAMIECQKRVSIFKVNEKCRLYAEGEMIIY